MFLLVVSGWSGGLLGWAWVIFGVLVVFGVEGLVSVGWNRIGRLF